jgi:hypothetical protein
MKRSHIKDVIRECLEDSGSLVEEEIDDIAENCTDKLMKVLDEAEEDDESPTIVADEQEDDEVEE